MTQQKWFSILVILFGSYQAGATQYMGSTNSLYAYTFHAEIRERIRNNQAEFNRCYSHLLESDKKAQGRVRLEWVVRPNGTVNPDSVAVVRSQISDKAFLNCLAGVVSSIDFPLHPESKSIVKIQYPFAFGIR